MFFTPEQIAKSIGSLGSVHPFHGITFLTCKVGQLPIGEMVHFPMDAKTNEFLEKNHRINPSSKYFYQPFTTKKSGREHWLNNDYSSSGLQAINTQTFRDAFLHERGTRSWGWHEKYVEVLASKLHRKSKIPAFDLTVWLYREKDWPDDSTLARVIARFVDDFNISPDEQAALFEMATPKELPLVHVFRAKQTTWQELAPSLPPAPDSEPERGGTLSYLEIKGLGPSDMLTLEPAPRLTLITGDNGLGKSFLLECAWWALTGTWAERPMYPLNQDKSDKPQITFEIESKTSQPQRTTIQFDKLTSSWRPPRNRPTMAGLTIYARVDGSFAVWDPIRQFHAPIDAIRSKVGFSIEEVWNGLNGRIEGLIRDWVRWQSNPSKSPFAIFSKVLGQLSPPDLGKLEPGEPQRIPNDPRDIPTIRHSYGTTPVIYESAGVRRIIALAYLVVWAWNEHVVAAGQAGRPPERRMVVLIDEMEAHLHPLWQRAVLPALLSVTEALSTELEAQYIVATHSPLVMASAEEFFDLERDSLVHLEMSSDGNVTLHEVEFMKFGDASSWLTSPIFELRQARSQEAEAAIEDAKALQLAAEPAAEQVKMVSERLLRYLPENDKFWPRWISFAEKFGVKI